METVKSQSPLVGEAIVWVIFVVVSATGSLYLLDLIKLTPSARLWAGRLLGAFSILALILLSYKANQRKDQ